MGAHAALPHLPAAGRQVYGPRPTPVLPPDARSRGQVVEHAGVYWHTAPQQPRWLARRIASPDVQAAAHIDELVERQGPAF